MEKIVLGHMLVAAEHPAEVTAKERFQHLYLIGKTRSGKSTFLTNLINNDLDQCCIVIDPAGGFAKDVASLADKSRLIYCDKNNPLRLNPLCRPHLDWEDVSSEFIETINSIIISSTSSPETTSLMERLMRNAVRALLDKPPAMQDIKNLGNLLEDKEVRRQYYKDDHFWGHFDDVDHAVKQYKYREAIDSAKRVTNRIAVLYDSPKMAAFTLGENQFDVYECVKKKSIVVFNLYGLDDDAKIYIGNLVITAIKSYFEHKPDQGGPPLYLYVDEFHRLKVNHWETFLSQSAKHNISVNLAHQDHLQISREALGSIMANCHVKVAFTCGADESVKMGGDFDLKPEELKNLGKYRCVARIGNKNYHLRAYAPIEIKDVFVPPNNEPIKPPTQAEEDLRAMGKAEADAEERQEEKRRSFLADSPEDAWMTPDDVE